MTALVLLESPYAGDVQRNEAYARLAMRDCFMRGEFPFASHLLYTQPGVLDDTIPAERALGIKAGLAWGRRATKVVVYADYGITTGMLLGLRSASVARLPIEVRYLGVHNGKNNPNSRLDPQTSFVKE